MKKIGVYLAIIVFYMSLFGVLGSFGGVHAATLQFNPTTVSTSNGSTFELEVITDAEDKNIVGVDALLQYDPTYLQVESITKGSYLEIGNQDTNESGKVNITAIVDQPGTSVTGKGTLAKITFKAKAGGKTTIKYICEIGDQTESNILEEGQINNNDLIECASNGTSEITISGDGPATSGGTATSSGRTGGTGGSSLPRTGILENMLAVAVIGGVLFIFGLGAKLLL